MRSHELAKLLLARRDNDICIEVIMWEDPTNKDDTAAVTTTVRLRDSKEEEPFQISSKDIVFYDTIADMLTIRAGRVFCPAHDYGE